MRPPAQEPPTRLAGGYPWTVSTPQRRPTTSSSCRNDEHGACSHRAAPLGLVASFTPGDRHLARLVTVCDCRCHDACPLYGTDQDGVREDAWRRLCSCPGAPADWAEIDARRQARQERLAASQERRSTDKDIVNEVRNGPPGRSADALRADFVSTLQRHKTEWPQAKLDMAVEMMTATTGNPLLAAPRAFRAVIHGFRTMRPGPGPSGK